MLVFIKDILRKRVFNINIMHIKTVQHTLGNGITKPKFSITEDNIPVVIKEFNGSEGNLVLFNEYFCYRLAILLEIDMPISGICLVDSDTEIMNEDFSKKNYGYGFYSTYLHKVAPLVDTIIPTMKNLNDFFKILLFDHIIFNTDRNPGNLLVQYYKNNITLKVIDHTHVFINQAIWDKDCLRRGMEEKDYYSTKILEYNNYLYSMFFNNLKFKIQNIQNEVNSFKDKITYDIMRDIINDIPKEWLPKECDINKLLEYILYRVDHLEDICITIRKYLDQ